MLVLGWDRPFGTWYAQLYDDHNENKPPRIVIGYNPVEVSILAKERPEAKVGPYPVKTREGLYELIKAIMGLEVPHA